MRNWRKSYDFSCWLSDYNRNSGTNWRPSDPGRPNSAPEELVELFITDLPRYKRRFKRAIKWKDLDKYMTALAEALGQEEAE